jgi:hypothetical protein
MVRKLRANALGTLAIMLTSSALYGQQAGKASPPAPIPAQILTAKSVFVSNAGGEEPDPQQFFPAVDGNEAYNSFYAAIANSGRYTLAPTPADADLILEIRFSDVFVGGRPNGSPTLFLRILDPKTHTLLWALTKSIGAAGGPHWKQKSLANFRNGIAMLVGQLTVLSSPQPVANKPLSN